MTRALMWKEWREQRPIVIAGLALSIVMPFVILAGMTVAGRRADLASVSGSMPLVIWPLLAVACGASTIAAEIGDGTLGFLLSRPASRLRVWLVKVAMAWLALLVIVAGTLFLIAIFSAAQGHGFLLQFGSSNLGPLEFLLGLVELLAAMLLLFACSVFFSTFVSRPMTAAVGGLVSALTIGAAIVLVWTRIDLLPTFEKDWMALEFAAAAVPVLAASLWIFTGDELLSGRRLLRHGMFGGAGALGAVLVAVIPAVLAVTRLDPQHAQLSGIHFVPRHNALVATAQSDTGSSPEVWLIHLDGSGIERLTGRLAGWPALSPDGRLVAYVSIRGALGLRADEPRLRVVSIDGGGDRVLAPSLLGVLPYVYMTGGGKIEWSPQGDRVALLYDDLLTIAPLNGSPVITRSLSRRRDMPGRCGLVGWMPNGKEIVLMASWAPTTLVLAYDPESDRARELFTSPRRRIIVAPGTERIVGDTLPLLLGPPSDPASTVKSGNTMVGIHLGDETVETLVEEPCWAGFDLSQDTKSLAYGACTREGTKQGRFELRLVDRRSGAKRDTEPFDGPPWEMCLSPSAEWIALSRFVPPPRTFPAAVVGLDGTFTEFEGPWQPLGWTGKSGVVLGEPSETGYRRIAVGDPASGDVRVVFP